MLLKVKDLKKTFTKKNFQKQDVLKGVDFSIDLGKTLCLVGKSGSGKSTIAHILASTLSPCSGEISFLDRDFFSLKRRDKISIQMIFQDPISSINPKMSIQEALEEPFSLQKKVAKPEDFHRLLELVELPKSLLKKRPHACSGGELQRVTIARALVLQPKLLICDEILASLDEPKKAAVVDLLIRLQKEQNISYLFITHELFWLKKFEGSVAVLFDGKIIEKSLVEDFFQTPNHVYTKTLVSSALS